MKRCECKKPVTVTTWEETFYGLFQDVAAETVSQDTCKTCEGVIRDWAPCAPLEPEPAVSRRPSKPGRTRRTPVDRNAGQG